MASPVLSRPQIAERSSSLSSFDRRLAGIMQRFCRPVDAPDYAGGTAKATVDNALDFMLLCVPQFREMVYGRTVLDFGCGLGHQAALLARDFQCDVTGVDLPRAYLTNYWPKMRALASRLELTTNLAHGRQFDVVYSCSAFEHFDDPEGILRLMINRCKPGGRVVVAFAEPWYSPHGSHMDGFCSLPWVNVAFPERVIMAVRNQYRTDGALRYHEVEGGLNQMTVARFERIIADSGLDVESKRLISVKRLPLVTSIPVVRELLTNACSVVLRKPIAS